MTLLLGFLTGLALVAPIGPVALTLFGLGTEQGRRAALAGAGGVVLGDLLTMPLALTGAAAIQALDPAVLRTVEVVLGVSLVVVAVTVVLAADRARDIVAGIRRPTRTMAAMTMVNPLTMAAWAGLALALPASLRAPASLVAFGAGLLLASACWHGGLAFAAAGIARRIGAETRTMIARVSGGVLLVVGGLLVV